MKELFKAIYYRNLTIEEAESIREEFEAVIGAFDNYGAKKPKYKEGKTKLLINARNFYDGREMIINAFRNKVFPMAPSGFSVYHQAVVIVNMFQVKKSKSNRFRYNFTNKLNLKNPITNIAPANLSIYYTWHNISSI